MHNVVGSILRQLASVNNTPTCVWKILIGYLKSKKPFEMEGSKSTIHDIVFFNESKCSLKCKLSKMLSIQQLYIIRLWSFVSCDMCASD